MNWRQAAASKSWKIQPFIDGRYRPSRSSSVFNNVNPASESVLCTVSIGDESDVNAAVAAARARFEDGSWSELPPPRRAEALLRLADLIVARADDLALSDALEMGKPIREALTEARVYAPGVLRGYVGFADKLLGATAPLDNFTLSFNTYEPRGVIGAITPWNFPTACAVRKLAPCLAAGNTVVLKPSELASASALLLGELALEAGIPGGVFNVIPGLGSTVGVALAAHPDVNMIAFTGSTATGRKVMETCARSNAKPLLLECGGKSPEIVFEDVEDLDAIADSVVQSIVWNQGQVCGAHTRLIVHASLAPKLIERVAGRASTYQPGDPLDEAVTFGPLASGTQRDRVHGYIEAAITAGARPVLRGRVQLSGGCYVAPTILEHVAPSMPVFQEEIFGPVLSVITFSTDAEAIRLANATQYGLAATVWTRDLGRAKNMAHAIRAGAISVRTGGKEGPPQGHNLSFNPQRSSGFGAEVGLDGLKSIFESQAGHIRGRLRQT